MREKNSIQYSMIEKLALIKALCNDTGININTDSIISHNIEEMRDLLDRISDELLELEEVLCQED